MRDRKGVDLHKRGGDEERGIEERENCSQHLLCEKKSISIKGKQCIYNNSEREAMLFKITIANIELLYCTHQVP